MDKIREIDQKIAELKTQKEDLKKKSAEAFYKKAETILGADFSPELALSILSVSWANKDDKICEGWQKTAETFRAPKRTQKKDPAAGS